MACFYDEPLDLYIYTTPLTISSKVVDTAKAIKLNLQWDSEGRICRVNHDEAMRLSAELGIVTLSVKEYMALAKRYPIVASSDFAEWLTDTYNIDEKGECSTAEGTISLHFGRPAWFDIQDIDDRGLPTKASCRSGQQLWKFWSPNPDDPGVEAGAMRSFVTSSGTCSWDLGIPTFAKHAMIMIRECYRTPKVQFTSKIDTLWNQYREVVTKGTDQQVRDLVLDAHQISSFEVGCNEDTLLNDMEQELMIDINGKSRLLRSDFAGLQTINLAAMCKALLHEATNDTVYVVGHEHPDADSAISAVFEAVRRRLIYPEVPCLPWSESIPAEVENVLGTELIDVVKRVPKFGPCNELILVDCHSLKGISDSKIKGVIDHHIIERKFPKYVAVSQERSWSSTLQVYTKILGSGFDLDSDTARILAEASILEAEPQLLKRCTELDRIAVTRLMHLAGHATRSYGTLRSLMIAGNSSPTEKFFKDYREITYGFAVIHCNSYEDFTTIAREHISSNHIPLCVIKQVLATDIEPWIASEKITLVFNEKFHDKGFRAAVFAITKAACESFHHQHKICVAGNIEKIVQEHLKFFYSKRTNKYISAGFYSGKREQFGETEDKNDPMTGLSFRDVEQILASSRNTSFMTLAQYWTAYNELLEMNDSQFLENMRDKQYVELLNTVITNKKLLNGQPTNFTPATPALIQPGLVDPITGIPTDAAILCPNDYTNMALWRYWSPDNQNGQNVATRGHIFVMDRTSLDLKVGVEEKTSKLSFRPVYNDIPDLKYEVFGTGGNWTGRHSFEVKVIPRLFSVFEMDGR